MAEIPIEERAASEVTHLAGRTGLGAIETILLTPQSSPAANPAFDVTPARLISGLITEHGVVAANAKALRQLMEDRR